MSLTRDDILKETKAKGIQFLRLQFVDVLGIPKNVEIPAKRLPQALSDGVNFDGSSIEGFVRIEESDMKLVPDLDTFTFCPWEKDDRVARIICDVKKSDGNDFEGCSRTNLKRILNEIRAKGFEMNIGTEVEFFMFKWDDKGEPFTTDKGSYFDLLPLDHEEQLRRDMVIALEELNFNIEASHHEVAPGQHEIDFQYGNALKIADNLITLKLGIKTLAIQNGYVATFMPKPVYGVPGSGMHTHLSLFKDGKNAFYDPESKYCLSKEAIYFIGGIMKHAKGLTAITNPLVNSYKRLTSGYEAPVHIAWSHCNRSPLIRIPTVRNGNGARIEFRCPDPSCNPYLAFAVILTAGMDGIQKKITPPDPVNENIYAMDETKLKKYGIECLPTNLKEALEEFKKDKVLNQGLTDHIISNYLRAKYQEWELYSLQVHPWELDQYLATY